MSEKVMLGDIAVLITKGTTPTSIGCGFSEQGINFVKSESISDHKYLDKSIYCFIDKATDLKLKRSRLADGDLLFSIAGAYLGKIGIVRADDVPANTNQAVGIVRLDKNVVDIDYAYYYFSQEHINRHINKLSSQSSQPNLNLDLLGKLEIDLKSLSVQKRISAVLSSLDAKIDLNNRINAELEAMAKTLYDYWFVQFDFPDKNGKPYKSSGGKMVWNKELKREIPEGWEVDNVLRVGELLGGGTPKTGVSEYWGGEIPFFTPADTGDSYFAINAKMNISKTGLESCSSKLFPKGTIFITARGTVGMINIASQDMAMNQSCYAVCPQAGVNYYFLHQFCMRLVDYLKAKANGSIFDAIVSNDIKLTMMPIPPTELIKQFGTICESAYKKILSSKQENQHLSSLRDWLLPMLMNGQVRVS